MHHSSSLPPPNMKPPDLNRITPSTTYCIRAQSSQTLLYGAQRPTALAFLAAFNIAFVKPFYVLAHRTDAGPRDRFGDTVRPAPLQAARTWPCDQIGLRAAKTLLQAQTGPKTSKLNSGYVNFDQAGRWSKLATQNRRFVIVDPARSDPSRQPTGFAAILPLRTFSMF